MFVTETMLRSSPLYQTEAVGTGFLPSSSADWSVFFNGSADCNLSIFPATGNTSLSMAYNQSDFFNATHAMSTSVAFRASPSIRPSSLLEPPAEAESDRSLAMVIGITAGAVVLVAVIVAVILCTRRPGAQSTSDTGKGKLDWPSDDERGVDTMLEITTFAATTHADVITDDDDTHGGLSPAGEFL
jgi:hypothetical protein